MKYKVTYTLQQKVSVLVDIKDKRLNKQFNYLGEIHNDKDFIDNDPRWEIEELAYDKYTSGEIYEDEEYDAIVDRSIVKFK